MSWNCTTNIPERSGSIRLPHNQTHTSCFSTILPNERDSSEEIRSFFTATDGSAEYTLPTQPNDDDIKPITEDGDIFQPVISEAERAAVTEPSNTPLDLNYGERATFDFPATEGTIAISVSPTFQTPASCMRPLSAGARLQQSSSLRRSPSSYEFEFRQYTTVPQSFYGISMNPFLLPATFQRFTAPFETAKNSNYFSDGTIANAQLSNYALCRLSSGHIPELHNGSNDRDGVEQPYSLSHGNTGQNMYEQVNDSDGTLQCPMQISDGKAIDPGASRLFSYGALYSADSCSRNEGSFYGLLSSAQIPSTAFLASEESDFGQCHNSFAFQSSAVDDNSENTAKDFANWDIDTGSYFSVDYSTPNSLQTFLGYSNPPVEVSPAHYPGNCGGSGSDSPDSNQQSDFVGFFTTGVPSYQPQPSLPEVLDTPLLRSPPSPPAVWSADALADDTSGAVLHSQEDTMRALHHRPTTPVSRHRGSHRRDRRSLTHPFPRSQRSSASMSDLQWTSPSTIGRRRGSGMGLRFSGAEVV